MDACLVRGTKMAAIEIVDLCSDDEGENVSKAASSAKKQNVAKHQRPQTQTQTHYSAVQVSDKSSSARSTSHSYSSAMEQELLHVQDTLFSPSISRNFWKAGNNDSALASKLTTFQNAENYLHVHPSFLHSNATSHKWAFGAIAELLDNAVDETQNGATFVLVDKIFNPKDGSPALLIQDDGGGMDPQAMLQCMSFGFSDKSKIAIGQYGNGFKTGSMRLGADVIVFSCHMNNMILTRSIGLLSYTFLMQKLFDRIVIPMVNYKFDPSTGCLQILNDKEYFRSNLSILLRWSPYISEAELLKQFDDIGNHGTKIIIFNLWFNDDGNLELDFDSDPEDICIAGHIKKIDTIPSWKIVNEEHIGNRFHYSLRAYFSILYLGIPESFRIILRGQVVKLHNIADDLKYTEFILYKPHSGDSEEGIVVTTIGFVKEAPEVNVRGFNVYHKNRLILPFWKVVNYSRSRGRGVVGILRADYLEPTHNKQDFERSSLFQKLGVRLKEMTWEYWDCHCHLIGYQESKAASLNKRKTHGSIDLQKMKRKAVEENVTVAGCDQNVLINASPTDQTIDPEVMKLMKVNKKLLQQCLEYEKAEEELNLKVMQLRNQIEEAHRVYDTLLAKAQPHELW
ncbi:protein MICRORCHIDIA 6 isoform X2 [Cajanus cajan]|uniref:protein MICRORCHIDIA 6 isoform X2 n=1 Tax=Cajanus cajan TaxID=3821 RepID=UPI0010FB9AED|nr:protein MICRORCHIDIA 6 isoform X2 [Cajanus cajan]